MPTELVSLDPIQVARVTPSGRSDDVLAAGRVLGGDTFDAYRMEFPAGKSVPEHHAPGEITVQCLSGRVDFHAGGRTIPMTEGTLLCLPAAEPHALDVIEDSVVLVTKMKARK